ncbi:uncharacterized protein I303_105019 [Kwoniella dejecticola CBS 10117]|uniref:Uncharacterized protein n=1 Tax=Kwoniella dejecticola CBS 10117 TaxID=1296121 RepID=A0A1A6A3P2_9TREE|nr:uncharacterized protein I303_05535 [Kwoniella dejecticola CBS 10117]OBR84676.1 hypothetical protein I303_05535 [Kwoniella dejecticola CBS 10117]
MPYDVHRDSSIRQSISLPSVEDYERECRVGGRLVDPSYRKTLLTDKGRADLASKWGTLVSETSKFNKRFMAIEAEARDVTERERLFAQRFVEFKQYPSKLIKWTGKEHQMLSSHDQSGGTLHTAGRQQSYGDTLYDLRSEASLATSYLIVQLEQLGTEAATNQIDKLHNSLYEFIHPDDGRDVGDYATLTKEHDDVAVQFALDKYSNLSSTDREAWSELVDATDVDANTTPR